MLRMHKSFHMIFTILMLVCFSVSAVADDSDKELVVLLHGIGHSEWNMAGIEFSLQKAGYETLNVGYPSLDKNISQNARFLGETLDKQGVWTGSYKKVHFATHSMGGLVIRTYLNDHKKDLADKNLGRVVMLAPPLGGSEVADLLKDFPPYQWLYGPAGQELTTQQQEKIKVDIYYDLGIIAGDKEWPYIVAAHVIPDKSDGRVALEKTKIKDMTDHMTVSATHSFISWKPSVHKQIIHFIKSGKFNHEKPQE